MAEQVDFGPAVVEAVYNPLRKILYIDFTSREADEPGLEWETDRDGKPIGLRVRRVELKSLPTDPIEQEEPCQ